MSSCCALCFFFVNDTATTEIYTLSLHDALPISVSRSRISPIRMASGSWRMSARRRLDRKSTRLNSSHMSISYAVFCLKKQNNWDFWTLLPEALHQLTILMSDPGIPKSLRHMHGFGIFFFKITEPTKISTFPKLHSLPH